MTRKTRIVVVTLAAAFSATGLIARAGDLNPPVGAVAPTQRTPVNANMTPGDADSLFKITQPGSYYLTGNITGVASKSCIEIDVVAPGAVTLDLTGFQIMGNASGLPGVFVNEGANTTPVTIRNGRINGGNYAIRSFAASSCVIEDVHVAGSTNGILCGANAVVRRCTVRDVGSTAGITLGANALVEACLAENNTGTGIQVGQSSLVRDCVANNNTGNGILTAGGGCTISNCSAHQNDGSGISATGGSTISNCSASSNTGNGIITGDGCAVSNCSAHQNTGSGIVASFGSTVLGCSVRTNLASGIVVDIGSTVADCSARTNNLDGIRCTLGCAIRDNTCSSNGNGGPDGASIHATGGDNRIEGNTCIAADRGIDVDSAGNIIIRNTCAGNTTNWDIAANNVYGPIIDRTAPASPAVLGNSAATTLGTTDPNANFSY